MATLKRLFNGATIYETQSQILQFDIDAKEETFNGISKEICFLLKK